MRRGELWRHAREQRHRTAVERLGRGGSRLRLLRDGLVRALERLLDHGQRDGLVVAAVAAAAAAAAAVGAGAVREVLRFVAV